MTSDLVTANIKGVTQCRMYNLHSGWQDDVSITSMVTSRVAAVRRLAACEKQFVIQMQTGVTNYVIALRHADVISRNDHDTLFINLETVNPCSVPYKTRKLTCQCN